MDSSENFSAQWSFWRPHINPIWSLPSRKYTSLGHKHLLSSNRLWSGIISVARWSVLDGFKCSFCDLLRVPLKKAQRSDLRRPGEVGSKKNVTGRDQISYQYVFLISNLYIIIKNTLFLQSWDDFSCPHFCQKHCLLLQQRRGANLEYC